MKNEVLSIHRFLLDDDDEYGSFKGFKFLDELLSLSSAAASFFRFKSLKGTKP